MEPVQALAIVSLGVFVGVLFTAIIYAATVRPRLLEPEPLSATGTFDEEFRDELVEQRAAVEKLNAALIHHTEQLTASAVGVASGEAFADLQGILSSQSDAVKALTDLLDAQAGTLAGLGERLDRQDEKLDRLENWFGSHLAPIFGAGDQAQPTAGFGGSNKMERFTQRARRVLSLAQEEAERMQHGFIGTEHILLGLLREEDGVAGKVLREMGLRPGQVEQIIERLTGGEKQPDIKRMDLSPGTKKVLELAVDEAHRLGHHYIGTEHLLLGLMRVPDGIALDVLRELKIEPDDVRSQIRRMMQELPLRSARRGREIPTQSLTFAQADKLAEVSARLDEWAAAHARSDEKLTENARILAELDRELAAQAQIVRLLDTKVSEHTTMLVTAATERREQAGLLQRILSQIGQIVPALSKAASAPAHPGQERLTDIKGIGPVYASKLYEAGIQTFRQLAAMTPEELYTLLNLPQWRLRSVNAQDWIEQAEHLASQREKVENLLRDEQ
jgi:predicted flap endonuclease-1-like 5' DNA nuclease